MLPKLLSFASILLVSTLFFSACWPWAQQQLQPQSLPAAPITAARTDPSVEAQVRDLQKQLQMISAIAAYHVWYDQYYNYSKGYYAFASADLFNNRLGSLVYSSGDSKSIKAWENYLVADKNSSAAIQTLPKEPDKWTTDEYNKWVKAYTVRVNALGEVGAALHNLIAK
jgi:hypothetical protein